MPRVKSERGKKKVALAQLLASRGFHVWHTVRNSLDLYGLMLLACNKLNPDNPWRAYRYLYGEFSRIITQTTHQKGQYRKKHQERLDELRRELAGSTSGEICPCCGKGWDTSELIPDNITE